MNSGNKAELFTLRPGFIRASMVVVCVSCQSPEPLPSSSIYTAGAFARERGWEFERTAGGWMCKTCIGAVASEIAAARARVKAECDAKRNEDEREARDKAARELNAWRTRRAG